MGVTLTVSGALITGIIVSGKRYFEEIGKRFAGANIAGPTDNAVLRDTLASGFSQWATIYAPENIKPLGLGKPNYIHLLDARFAMGSQLSGPGFAWRGKLRAIDGISIGSMTAS
jgi:hypothetical protein